MQMQQRKEKSTPFGNQNSGLLRQHPGADAALHVMHVQGKHKTGMHVQIGRLHRKRCCNEACFDQMRA